MKKTEEKSTTAYLKKIIPYISSNLRMCLFIAFTSLIVICGIIMFILSFTQDYVIGISIVRDINIMLISTTATLLGLYVTAFIFLSDSLKNRSKEDPKILEAVNNIIGQHRNTMLLIVIGAIVTILLQVICNILLGKPQLGVSIEDMRLPLNSCEWCFFLVTAVISLILIVGIVISSSSITDSDNLITQRADKNLKYHQNKLICRYDDIVEKATNDYNVNKSTNECDVTKSSGEELLRNLGSEKYTFEVAYRALKKDKIILMPSKEKSQQIKKDEQKLGKEDFIIRLGKVVRFIETVINRICDNNIDKSVISGDLYNQSIEAGFKLLYARSASRPELDIRDEKRYLDYLKYQIITNKRYETKPFDNEEIEKAFDLAKNKFTKLAYQESDDNRITAIIEKFALWTDQQKNSNSQTSVTQKLYIDNYKKYMTELIQDFFQYYDDLIGYRDALLRSYQYSNNNKHKKKNKTLNGNNSVSIEELKILYYAEICKRVLIDRFTSFVKIDELNLGNSTLDKGWFNYSELTGGNFTHSSLRFVRMENATCRKCDFSTCSFILSDASNSDFSESNFSYSDLTGVDLTGCNFTNAQMDAVVLRDSNLDDYDIGLILLFSHSDPNTNEETNTYIRNRDKWFSEHKNIIQATSDSNTKAEEERIKKFYQLLRSGESIMKDVFEENCTDETTYNEIHWAYSVNSNDTTTNILIENGKSLLRGSAAALSAKMRDFFLYRKYRRLPEEIYRKINDARVNEELDTKMLREETYGKINFGVAKLDSASINEVSMKGIDFSYVSMNGASFRNSDLSDGEMYYTYARNVMFQKTNLNKIDAYGAHFSGSNFSEATLVNATLVNCEFDGCNFERALMLNTLIANGGADEGNQPQIYLENFLQEKENEHSNVQRMLEKLVVRDIEDVDEECNFKECDFVNAIANNLVVLNVNMMRSKFNLASVRNAFFYNVLLHWGAFNEANFANSIFVGSSFHHSALEKADFSRVRFFACEFSNANLHGTNLISARMEKVLFDETNLASCNFSSARIANCSFNKCNFDKVIFDKETIFENCIFSGIDFSTAVGLSEAKIKNCIFELDEHNGMCTELEIILSKSYTQQPVSVSLEDGTNGVDDKKLYSTDEI